LFSFSPCMESAKRSSNQGVASVTVAAKAFVYSTAASSDFQSLLPPSGRHAEAWRITVDA
jgi:hypothetical protein